MNDDSTALGSQRMFRLLLLSLVTVVLVAAIQPVNSLLQEVVAVDELPLAELRRSTVAYLRAADEEKPKRQRGQWRANADSSTFTYEADFLLYNRKAVKHPIGEVTYRSTINLKEGKYRYTADSAYFQEYRRNRYSRYVPSRSRPVAWEQAKQQLSEKEQQRAYRTLSTRFQAFQNFVEAYVQVASATPAADQDW